MSIKKILPNQTPTSGVTKNDIADFCDWEMGDRLTFGRFNLIYGYNGAGKTTLSDLIKSKNNNIEFEFKENCELFVFNKNYIRENISTETIKPVYVEEKLDGGKRVDFGENVSIKKEIKTKELDKEAFAKIKKDLLTLEKELELILTKNAKEISDAISDACNARYNNFQSWRKYNKANLKPKILSQSNNQFELSDDDNIKTMSSQIQSLLQRESLDLLNSNINDVDCSDIPQLLKDYSVGERISELDDNPTLRTWVKEGLAPEIHQNAGDKCKFCDNKISDERWSKLKQYFDQTAKIIDEKIKSITEYKEQLEKLNVDIFFPNKEKIFQKNISNYESAEISFLQEKENQIFSAKKIISILNSKNSKINLPTQKLSMFSYLDSVNSIIEINNRELENEIQKEVDELVVKIERSIIANFLPEYKEKKEEINNITSRHGNIERIQSKVIKIENEILQLNMKLKNSDVFCQYFNDGIKNYLGHEDFSLSPSENKKSYIILRKNEQTKIESLSEGEKTAFVLLYFLFSLEEAGLKIKEKIIVIDDPISSLDSIHLHTAFSFIKRRVEGAKQIIILTHNLNFAQRVIKWFSSKQQGEENEDKKEKDETKKRNENTDNIKNTAQYFMLEKKRSGNKHLFKIKKMPKSIRHHCSLMCYLFKRLHNLSKDENPEPFDYINAPHELRQFLEIYVSIWQPSGSSSPENLKEIWKGIWDKEMVSSVVSFCNCHTHASPVNEIGDEFSILTANDNEFLKKIFKAIEEHNSEFHKVLIQSKD